MPCAREARTGICEINAISPTPHENIVRLCRGASVSRCADIHRIWPAPFLNNKPSKRVVFCFLSSPVRVCDRQSSTNPSGNLIVLYMWIYSVASALRPHSATVGSLRKLSGYWSRNNWTAEKLCVFLMEFVLVARKNKTHRLAVRMIGAEL